ncbi:Transglutaminase-like superfamily protein [Alteromonadaceae bacterium Bs31]|nr:Transglutaminase-like superfamily protein [Alteromonadaceae bacterium Bs31]
MNIKNLKSVADKKFPDAPVTYKLKRTFFCVLKYIHKNDWTGACHATSAVMYMLLKEQDIDVRLYIGEVARGNIIFDHSWVEYDGQPIDAAISNTLTQGIMFSPVFCGIELETGNPTESNYAFQSGQGLGPEMLFYSSNTLGFYLDGFPRHSKGLWGIASILAKELGVKFNIGKAKEKYSDEHWLQKS